MLMPTDGKMLNSSQTKRVFWALDADSIRLLYHGLQLPTVLMLLCGIAFVWFLRDTVQPTLLLAWFMTVLGVAALRLVSGRLFQRATPTQQTSAVWMYALFICAGVSGCLLSFVAIVFIPEQVLSQQLLLLGLLSVVAISASIAFAVNFYLFICYVACGCLPIIYVYLTADSALLNGLGLLMLMYLAAMTAAGTP